MCFICIPILLQFSSVALVYFSNHPHNNSKYSVNFLVSLFTNKTVKLLTQFQQYKVTHYCIWEIDCKRLDWIHIYTFTVCIVICWQSMSLRYIKEKDKPVLQHFIAQWGKNYKCKHGKHTLGWRYCLINSHPHRATSWRCL